MTWPEVIATCALLATVVALNYMWVRHYYGRRR